MEMDIYYHYYGASAGQGIGIRKESKTLKNSQIEAFLKDLSSMRALESAKPSGDLYYLLSKNGYAVLGKSFIESPKQSGYNRSAPCGIQYVTREENIGEQKIPLDRISFDKPDSAMPDPLSAFPQSGAGSFVSVRPEALAELVDGLVRTALSQQEVLLAALPRGEDGEFARAAMAAAFARLPGQLRQNIRFFTSLPVEEGTGNCVTGFDNAVANFGANVLFCSRQSLNELKSYRSFIGLDLEQPSGQICDYAKIIAWAKNPAELLKQMEKQLNDRNGWTMDLLNKTAVKADRELEEAATSQRKREAQRTRQRTPNVVGQENNWNYKTDGRNVQNRTDSRPLDIEVHRAQQTAGRNEQTMQSGEWNKRSPRKGSRFWIFDAIIVIVLAVLVFGGYLLYKNVFAKKPAEPTAQPVQQVIPTEVPAPTDSLPTQEDGQQTETEQQSVRTEQSAIPAEQQPAEEQPGQNETARTAVETGTAEETEPVITEAPIQVSEPTAAPTPEPIVEPAAEPAAVPAEVSTPVPTEAPATAATEPLTEPTPEPKVFTAPITNKELLNRYATVKTNTVNFRETPSTSASLINTLSKGKYVWVVRTVIVADTGEEWAEVYFGGRHGYIMRKYLNVLSQEASKKHDAVTKNKQTPVPEQLYGT